MILTYAWLTSLGGMGSLLASVKLLRIQSAFMKRKICHFGCGTVMILCWPLFPVKELVHLAAASIPFLGTMHFVLIGTGIVKDPHFVNNIGVEEGQERRLLLGPVQYGVCATMLTAAAFRTPLSVIPICVLCAGDSAAAVWGFYKGKKKLPWNKGKTYEGMAAFVVGSCVVTLGILNVLERTHVPGWTSCSNIAATITASLVGAVVETAPPVSGFGNTDNVLVPLSSVAVCALMGAY